MGDVDLRGAGAGRERERAERVTKVVKAVLYAVQVFYSFFIMWVSLLATSKNINWSDLTDLFEGSCL